MDAKELIAQVRRIEIRTRKVVDDIVCGAYHSRFKGRGMEFDEVREYVPGDDVRDIDWNVTARMGAPFIKKYVEERELHVILAVDVSASGFFGSAEKTKIRTQAEIAALLALSAIRNHDKVGMVTFTDKIESHLPMRSGRAHILRMIRDLVGTTPQHAGTSLQNVFAHLQRTLTKRTVIFVISDMLDDVANWSRDLGMLSKRHDVIIVRVNDPVQTQWHLGGYWNIADAESQKTRLFHATSGFKRRYAFRSQEAEEQLEHEALKRNAGFIPMECGCDIVAPLMRYFNTCKGSR